MGSNLIRYTRWNWGKSHARIYFRHPILVQNDNKKNVGNIGSQMGHTDKKNILIKKNKDIVKIEILYDPIKCSIRHNSGK